MRPLGSDQKLALRIMLQPSGGNSFEWAESGPWILANHSHTVRIMESLEKRGLVRLVSRGGSSRVNARRLVYRLTDAGRDAAEIVRAERYS